MMQNKYHQISSRIYFTTNLFDDVNVNTIYDKICQI